MKLSIFVLVALVIIAFAFRYAGMRQKGFKEQSQRCEQECKSQGYEGWEYKAGSFGKGQCQCLHAQ